MGEGVTVQNLKSDEEVREGGKSFLSFFPSFSYSHLQFLRKLLVKREILRKS